MHEAKQLVVTGSLFLLNVNINALILTDTTLLLLRKSRRDFGGLTSPGVCRWTSHSKVGKIHVAICDSARFSRSASCRF